MKITKILLNSTHTNLVRLAALVWYAGVVILLFNSSGMFVEASTAGMPVAGILCAAAAGVMIGILKAKYIFIAICRKNIKRIVSLETPRIWQCYRIRFFVFLFLMVTFGNWAYHQSRSSALMLMGLAALELSVSTALLISSRCFRKKLS